MSASAVMTPEGGSVRAGMATWGGIPGTGYLAGYMPSAVEKGIKWFLDANEGRPAPAVVEALAEMDSVEAIKRYPRATALEAEIERRPGASVARLPAGSVLVTSGSDDAIARACRVFLGRGDRLLVFEPSFEMFSISARLVGAEPVRLDWPEGTAFPLLAAIETAKRYAVKAVALATPANPTGSTASPEDIRSLADALPETSIWVDGAYGEFAARDTLAAALSRPNLLAIRTFSKAYGLAGLRLGWVAGPPDRIGALRTAGAPYPVGGLSVAAGLVARSEAGEAQMSVFVARVKEERSMLLKLLSRLGARTASSEANFVFARVRSAPDVKRRLAKAGIAIRTFAGRVGLEDAIRVTCPGDAEGWEALDRALRASEEWL